MLDDDDEQLINVEIEFDNTDDEIEIITVDVMLLHIEVDEVLDIDGMDDDEVADVNEYLYLDIQHLADTT